MKIVQLFKSESGDLALDEDGNIYRVFPASDKEDDMMYWKNELKFVRIKQIFDDRVVD